jgi:tetratricopeptide (TPR) repeat protein
MDITVSVVGGVGMRVDAKRTGSIGGKLVSALRGVLPDAFIQPSSQELIALYRLRYRIALDEGKFDSALIFLDKILEVEPANAEAKLLKGELYHRHLRDYGRAVETYSRVIRVANERDREISNRARAGLTELMELLS